MIKANISWNAKQIAKAVTNGSMTFDNAIQRGHVWDVRRQSLFIDSLLRNFPVPPMYTIKTDIDAPDSCKKGSKVFDCIDGKQRCEAIRAFRNNEFVLVGLDTFDENGEEVNLNGKTFDELSEEMRDAFDSYTMTVYFFTDITDEEVADMMSRLNNGKPLTGVENARIKAKNLPAIIKLGSHKLFKDYMTEASLKAYNNEDVVLKTVLQLDEQLELSAKNVKAAYESVPFDEEQTAKINAVLDTSYDILAGIKEADNQKARKAMRKIVKKTNLVAMIYFAASNLEEDLDTMTNFLIEFFSSDEGDRCVDEYNEACTNGTNHASNVLTRNEALSDGYAVFSA